MRLLLSLTAAAILATHLPAQQPTVVHAQLTAEAAPNGPRPVLGRLERSGQTAWLAYSIPTNDKVYLGNHSQTISYLESENANWSSGSQNDSSNPAEDHVLLLFRIANHHIGKLRVESASRTLDAGGLPVVFLTGVSPEQSLETLQALALDPAARPLRDSAVFAVSLHRSPSTVPTLVTLAAPGRDPELREKAAFWLGVSKDPAAFPVLQRFARTDPDPRFREKLAFDLTLVKEDAEQPASQKAAGPELPHPKPAALDELIRMAHADSAPEVRKQAQFWMATLGGQRVTANLRAAAEADPNQDVRRSAVFALSQLPAGQATPQLIHLAKTSRDPEVRKQAVFWLGQFSDPSALDYLTALLKQ